MILVDFNQVLISNLMSQIGSSGDSEIKEDLVRHMVLTSLLSYKKKFGKEYGEVVLCVDYIYNYWRKDIFPYYKAGRKKSRAKSKFNWPKIYETLNMIRSEITEHFPYKVIEVKDAEADDIIAILCKFSQTMEVKKRGLFYDKEPVMIVSGDKDFLQLQKYKNVKQFSPMKRKMLTIDNADVFLKEHIMMGDVSDGVPNFLSEDDTFMVEGKRQKPLYKKKIQQWVDKDPKEFCDDIMYRNYKRNEVLIDLSCIPSEIEDNIIETYEKYECSDKSLYTYFVKKKLKHFLECVGDF